MSKKIKPQTSKSEQSKSSNVLFNPLNTLVVNDVAKDKKVAVDISKIKPVTSTASTAAPNFKPIIATKKPVVKQIKKSVVTSKPKIVSSKITKKISAQKPLAIVNSKPKNERVVNETKKNTLILPHEHDSYFVYLKNPLEYRRHLLESSRKILFCLKGHQKVLLIRQKKLDEMRKLRNSVKELLYLNKKFNELLPKYNMAVIHHNVETKNSQSAVIPKVQQSSPLNIRKPVPIREKTEIDKLEDSLANIERKLRTLQ